MAELTSRTELDTLADTDLIHVVDVSDTTDSANGTSKKSTISILKQSFELYRGSYQSAITAFAGGGQASATALTKARNRVDTVATTNDSCKLLTAVAGTEQEVFNNGANDLNLYPQTGENFLGLAANTPILVVAGSIQRVFCYATGVWTY